MRLIKDRFTFVELIFLGIVVFFATLLYLHKLDSVPSGFYVDEATTAYNSYSIQLTGKDEYGMSYPVVFRSLGLYLTPMYIYLSTLAIKFLGLSVYSARIVAVISGILSGAIMFIFFKKFSVFKSRFTPVLASGLFLITPWIFFYSRIGYEISLSYLFMSISLLSLWLSLNNPKYVFLSLVVGSIGVYAGFMPRYLIPLIYLTFFIIYRENFLNKIHAKYLITGLFLSLLIQIPNFSILSTPAFFLKTDLLNSGQLNSQAQKLSVVFVYPLNYIFAFLREFLSNYFAYFSPKSLFFYPDPDLQRSIPDLSVFYPWMMPIMLFGIYVFSKLKNSEFKKFILLVIFVSPIPASIAKDPFASHRAIFLLFPLTVFIALGLDRILQKFKFKYVFPVLVGLVVISLVSLWRSYFIFYEKERAEVSGYGYAQLAEITKNDISNHYVIDQSRIKPSYIEMLFHLKYPPKEFQEISKLKVKDYYSDIEYDGTYSIANIENRNIVWEKDIYIDQVLVGDEYTISESQAKEHSLSKVFEIKDPLGNIVFVGHKTNPEKKCAMSVSKSIYCIDGR